MVLTRRAVAAQGIILPGVWDEQQEAARKAQQQQEQQARQAQQQQEQQAQQARLAQLAQEAWQAQEQQEGDDPQAQLAEMAEEAEQAHAIARSRANYPSAIPNLLTDVVTEVDGVEKKVVRPRKRKPESNQAQKRRAGSDDSTDDEDETGQSAGRAQDGEDHRLHNLLPHHARPRKKYRGQGDDSDYTRYKPSPDINISKYAQDNPPKFPVTQDWSTGFLLGAGGHGAAMIYARFGEDNAIVDTVVVKDTHVQEEMFIEAASWGGDPRDPETHHVEIATMRNWQEEGADHLVYLRGYHTDYPKRFYRIFINLCNRGSLQALQNNHVSNKVRIEEEALWSIVEGLIDACRVLARGPGAKSTNWKTIVHRDFKPDNIFLEDHFTDKWPSWPRLRLGDFGIAIMTHDRDWANPMFYNNGFGTPDWVAPEQFRWGSVRGSTDTTWPLGEKTNIWAMGAVLVRLMNNTGSTSQGGNQNAPASPAVSGGARKKYSKDLIRLAESCCAFLPDARPSIEDLEEMFNEHMERHVVKSRSEPAEDEHHLILDQDKVPIEFGNVYDSEYKVDDERRIKKGRGGGVDVLAETD